MKIKFVLLSIQLLIPSILFAVYATLYVDPIHGSDDNSGTKSLPFKSIWMAKSFARNMNTNMEGDIVIFLRKGTYRLYYTLSFQEMDSGKNGYDIIYRNYPGERPIISGAIEIQNWDDEGNGLISADIDSRRFRQFFTNTNRAIRAKHPNNKWLNNAIFKDKEEGRGYKKFGYIEINQSDIDRWQRPDQIELVAARSYVHSRYLVNNIELQDERARVYVKYPADMQINQWGPFGYYWENAIEFLDQEGEWYLDTDNNKIYYKLRKDETRASLIGYIPVVERLLEINGAHNLKFYGLVFQNTTWNEPSLKGYRGRQGGIHFDPETMNGKMVVNPASIYLKNCRHVLFKRNIFKHLGANGVNLDHQANDIDFIGNVFYEIAESCLFIGMDGAGENKNIIIKNNFFTKMGIDYHGGLGIFCKNPAYVLIEHNELYDGPGLGMNVGWGPFFLDNLMDVRIKHNFIHKLSQITTDSGGIHTRNRGKNMLLYENYFKDINKDPSIPTGTPTYPVAAIYLDGEGKECAGWTVDHNVFVNCNKNIHEGSRIWEGNNQILDNNDNRDPNVINTAGLEPEYQDIKLYIKKGSIGGTTGPYGSLLPVKSDLSEQDKQYSFQLYQNYPNPFNSETRISFYLKKKSNVKLNVFNLNGKKICQLLSKNKISGSWTCEWIGRDELNRPIPSGIYFCHLLIENGYSTRQSVIKMIMVK